MSPRETSAQARGEERRARVRSEATAGVTTAIRTLFPCLPIRFPGKSCVSPLPLDEIISSHLYCGPFHRNKPCRQIRSFRISDQT
jgi:hypothetical protein